MLNFSIDARFFRIRDRWVIITGSAVNHRDMCGLVGGGRMCSKVNTSSFGKTEVISSKMAGGTGGGGGQHDKWLLCLSLWMLITLLL